MKSLAGVVVCAAILLTLVLGTGSAEANSPINSFSLSPSSTQAGGHPDVRTLIWMSNSRPR